MVDLTEIAAITWSKSPPAVVEIVTGSRTRPYGEFIHLSRM